MNKKGERTGFWYLDSENQAVSKDSKNKTRQGSYLHGRKNGAWTFFNEEGQIRLIGEYRNNRPDGAYFRFNNKGELTQANNTKANQVNLASVDNPLFICKMNFNENEIIAGQVYFKTTSLKNNSIQFWNTQNLESVSQNSKTPDFTWFDENHQRLFELFLSHRNPTSILSQQIIASSSNFLPRKEVARTIINAPIVDKIYLAKGAIFQPNGWNKLYTEQREIWMDGLFKDGQLQNGKVFVYDADGVLLKVRVFKNGEYISDGEL